VPYNACDEDAPSSSVPALTVAAKQAEGHLKGGVDDCGPPVVLQDVCQGTQQQAPSIVTICESQQAAQHRTGRGRTWQQSAAERKTDDTECEG
jgi:hypothetical protein